MTLTRDRIRSLGWAVTFAICLALLAALTLRVNAVKSQVLLTERRIVAVERNKLALETEFQTRSNQQQLTALNEVEFGYTAPGAGQYVAGERQLAALARPVAPDAASPVLMASADGDTRPAVAARAGAPVETALIKVASRETVRPAVVRPMVLAAAFSGAPPRAGSFPAVVAPLTGASLAAVPRRRLLREREPARVSTTSARIALSDTAETGRAPNDARVVKTASVARPRAVASAAKSPPKSLAAGARTAPTIRVASQ